MPWPNRIKIKPTCMLKEEQICPQFQSFWGEEHQSSQTQSKFRLDSEHGSLCGTSMLGVGTVLCMFSALGLTLGFIMRQRTGGRRHLCHCSLYCTFIFLKKKKKFYWEFKFFMLFHSEQMNLFPKIIRKLFQHVSYVTLS